MPLPQELLMKRCVPADEKTSPFVDYGRVGRRGRKVEALASAARAGHSPRTVIATRVQYELRTMKSDWFKGRSTEFAIHIILPGALRNDLTKCLACLLRY